MTTPSVSGNNKPNSGYNTITVLNKTTGKKKSFLIPIGQHVEVYYNGKTLDPDLVKNHEIFIIGDFDNSKSKAYLAYTALDALDVNDDGKIDSKDTDFCLGSKINKKLNKANSPYYVKDNETYSDASIGNGEGGVLFMKKGDNGYERAFDIEIEKKQ